jgi:hypothetical protein
MPRLILGTCLATLLVTCLLCTGCSFGEAPYTYSCQGRLITPSGQPATPGTPIYFSTQGDLKQVSSLSSELEKFYQERSRLGDLDEFGRVDTAGHFHATGKYGLVWGYMILGMVLAPTPPMLDAGSPYVRRAETWQQLPVSLTPDQQKHVDWFRSERQIDLGDVILPEP